MPTFQVENTGDDPINFDFEVYCNTCGEGLCNESEAVATWRRRMASVRVNACPACLKKKDERIEELEAQVSELEKLIAEAAEAAS